MSVDDYVRMFRDIYFPTANYGKSKTEIFTRVVKAFGGTARYMFRLKDPQHSAEYLAKLFAWYCALANRLNISVDNILWSKYPGVCCRCLQPSCTCGDELLEVNWSTLTDFAVKNASMRPRTLREWQERFATIYRGPLGNKTAAGDSSVALSFARLAEELGEVAEVIDAEPLVDVDYEAAVRNEMADVMAWVLALANRLPLISEDFSGKALADIVWERYAGRCMRCKKNPCVCVRGQLQLELATRGAMGPSQFDERTNLANYGALELYTDQMISEYRSENGVKIWALLFFDIDLFKKVNTDHGHPAGDIVLRAVAEVARDSVRDVGLVFRRGGEEFVVILKETSLDSASAIAERLRANIADRSIILPSGIAISVTASVGVSSTSESGVKPAKLEEVAERRERKAKESGRNRVVASD